MKQGLNYGFILFFFVLNTQGVFSASLPPGAVDSLNTTLGVTVSTLAKPVSTYQWLAGNLFPVVGMICSASQLPQAIKICHTGRGEDVSTVSACMDATANALAILTAFSMGASWGIWVPYLIPIACDALMLGCKYGVSCRKLKPELFIQCDDQVVFLGYQDRVVKCSKNIFYCERLAPSVFDSFVQIASLQPLPAINENEQGEFASLFSLGVMICDNEDECADDQHSALLPECLAVVNIRFTDACEPTFHFVQISHQLKAKYNDQLTGHGEHNTVFINDS